MENNAAPLTSSTSAPTSETPPLVVVTETVTSTVTIEPVAQIDNRIGFGPLKLGMSLDDARAAGLTALAFQTDHEGECVADDKILVSKKNGIERITLPSDAKTSKGIGVGSTFGDVKKAYPTATEYRSGMWVRIDGNAGYQFRGEPGSDANKVDRIKIHGPDISCALAQL